MVGITALVGCDVTQITHDAGEQVIVKLEDGNGFVEEYTANDLFKDYSVTSTGASQYFNAVYDVLIRTVQKKDSSITNKVNEKLRIAKTTIPVNEDLALLQTVHAGG